MADEEDEELDDFELERTRQPEETVSPYRPSPLPRRSGLLFPVTLVAGAVLAIGLLATLFFVFRHPTPPKLTSTPVPLATAPVEAGPTPAAALPALDDSDPFARQLAAALSSRPELARWLAQGALIRTLTAIVLNVAAGESPRPHLEFLAPAQRFRAGGRGRRIVCDPVSFSGYDSFANTVASIDAGSAVRGYRVLEPLFDAAYHDLGRPEGHFAEALGRAITALLAVPALKEDVALVPHATGFRYVDPRLEGLTAAQKQFLRIGPHNVRLVQGKLREIEAALGPASALKATPALSR